MVDDSRKVQKRQIIAATLDLLNQKGPSLPSYSQIVDQSDLSRQLIRYYFDDPDMLMREVCDLLGEAYGMALVNGVAQLKGQRRLEFIFDFYFDLIEDIRKPRDDQAYDAMFAFAAGSEGIRTRLRGQYTLLGQVLQLELKMQYPDLSLEDCAEITYLFVCIMYGHWKMVASLGLIEDHRLIARRSVDRSIASYLGKSHSPIASVKVWDRKT